MNSLKNGGNFLKLYPFHPLMTKYIAFAEMLTNNNPKKNTGETPEVRSDKRRRKSKNTVTTPSEEPFQFFNMFQYVSIS